MLVRKGKRILRHIFNKKMAENEFENIFEDLSLEKSVFQDFYIKKKTTPEDLNTQSEINADISEIFNITIRDEDKKERVKEFIHKDDDEIVPLFWQRFFNLQNNLYPDANDMRLNYDLTVKLNPTHFEILFMYICNIDKSYVDLSKVLDYYISIFWYHQNGIERLKIANKLLNSFQSKIHHFEVTLNNFALSIFLKPLNLQTFIPYIYKLIKIKNEKKYILIIQVYIITKNQKRIMYLLLSRFFQY